MVCHCIDKCNSMDFSTFIIGDFNLPYITWSIPVTHGGPSHHFFLKYCQENSRQQHTMEPTIFTENTLDLLLTNPSSASNIISYNISEPLCSTCDHFMIEIQVTNTLVTHSAPPQLDFKNANYLSIINNLYQCNRHDMIQHCGNNSQLLYDCILHELHLNIHDFVPYKQKPKGKPHSREIKRKLYLKKCFYKKLKAGQCTKDQCQKISKEYDLALARQNDIFENTLCSNANYAKFYGYARKKLKCKFSIPSLKFSKEFTAETNYEKADCLNSTF